MSSDVTAVMTAMTDAERPWVQSALGSILSQSVLPTEVILIIEERNEWLEGDLAASGLSPALKGLIRLHRMPLARLGAVRNAGTSLATTKWVAFLDGDDVWKTRRLEWQLAAARDQPEAEFIGGDFVFINAAGRPFAFSNGSTPTPSSWLVGRSIMLRHPFDPLLPMGEDHFWLKATRHECLRVRVPRVVTGYRIRGQSLSALQFGQSRQRKIRELMARASTVPLVRHAMLGLTYARYLVNRSDGYEV